MSKLKGSGWLVNFEYIKKTFGEEAHLKAIEQLTVEDQRKINRTMVAASWGPDFSVFMRYIKQVDKLYGKGDLQVLRHAAANHFNRDLGLYALFFKVLKPEMIIKNIPKIWRQYFNPAGTIEIDFFSAKHFQMRLAGFENMPVDHEKYHNSYLEEILKKYKFPNSIITHYKCLGRGDDECVFDVKW